MQVTLPFGTDTLNITLPKDQVFEILEPRGESAHSEKEILVDAISNPIESPPLDKIVRKGEKSVLVVPDATRRCGAKTFLKVIINTLNERGIKDSDILILFANGSNGVQTREQHRTVVGEELLQRVPIIDHNFLDDDSMLFLGYTKAGTPVAFNKLVVKAERLIVTGGVSHHPLTGYAGGPKMLNPGCAGKETILKTHSLGINPEAGELYSGCASGETENNPLYTDVLDSTKFVQTDFSLHVIINMQGKVVGACAGNAQESFVKAQKIADKTYRVPFDEKVDIAITSCGGAPFDDDFIKIFRSLHNGARVLNDGGRLIMFAQCPDGIGNARFKEYFSNISKEKLVSDLTRHYHQYGNTALCVQNILEKIRVTIVGNLESEAADLLGIDVTDDAQQAVTSVLTTHTSSSKIYIIPHAHFTVPQLRER